MCHFWSECCIRITCTLLHEVKLTPSKNIIKLYNYVANLCLYIVKCILNFTYCTEKANLSTFPT
jgi:hypothetical protein